MNDPRQELLTACRALHASGQSPGTSGNLSARDGDGFWITPSGVAYETLSVQAFVHMDLDGNWQGDLHPSSEWRFHLDIYRAREDAGGICHTHSPHATGLACTGQGIPAFHYMVAAAGGSDIRCAPYHTFGTQALSDAALAALRDRKACLLANHGLIALGATVAQAQKLALEVETLAQQYRAALSFGAPAILPDDEMQTVIERFQTYGQPRPAEAAD